MARKDPEGYTAEQWAAYQADPVGFCVTELASNDSRKRGAGIVSLAGHFGSCG